MEKHSEEIKNILGKPPKFLVRFGTSFMVLALLGMLIGMWFISYPRKVDGRLVMTTIEAPVSVVPQTSGYISLFKKEGEMVVRGEELAEISNQAKYLDVVFLEQKVIELMEFEGRDYLNYEPNISLLLGDIQPAYNAFNSTIDDFVLVSNDRSDDNKKSQIRNQIDNNKNSIKFLDKQIRSYQQLLRIEHNKQAKQKNDLHKDDYDELLYSEYLKEVEKLKNLIDNAKQNKKKLEAEISSKKFDIFEENHKQNSGSQSKFKDIENKLIALKGSIEKWKEKYILKAPAEGKVTFYDTQSAQQFISKGDEFMAIVPEHTSADIIGKMQISLIGSGKVEEGQKVLLKFDTYPFLEYGYVEGKVLSKALLPTPKEEKYNLQIELPNGLKTSRGDTLAFRQNMLANAEIITEDASLLKRVFASVLKVFS